VDEDRKKKNHKSYSLAIKEILKRYNVKIGSYGRDGNVFVKITSKNKEEIEKAKEKLKNGFNFCLQLLRFCLYCI